MPEHNHILVALKLAVLTSIFFASYESASKEFFDSNFPSWLIKFLGVLKICGALMIQSSDQIIMRLGCLILIVIIAGSVTTHLRIKKPIGKIWPSLTLLSFSIIILLYG